MPEPECTCWWVVEGPSDHGCECPCNPGHGNYRGQFNEELNAELE